MRRRSFGMLACVVFALVCAWGGTRTLVEEDAIGLVLAVDQQDVRAHQPPPPGFILYVWSARFVDAWIDDPLWALRLVALASLVAAALLCARVAERLGDATTGRAALAAFLASPLVLYHAMTATSFPGEALVSALAGFWCVRALARNDGSMRAESYLIALCVGLRAQAALVALPLAAWTAWRLRMPARERAFALLAGCLGTVCWLLPQADVAGSLGRYVDASWNLARAAAATTLLGGDVAAGFEHAQRLALVLLCGLGLLRVVALALTGTSRAASSAKARTLDTLEHARGRGFWIAWLAPGAVWQLLFGLRVPGSALGLWPALCVLAALAWRTRVRVSMRIVAAAALLDVVAFFLVPIASLRGVPGALLGDATFFHDRVRAGTLGESADSLRATDIDMARGLALVSVPEQRALAYEVPALRAIHADALRPEPVLVYHHRRARAVTDTYEVPAEVRWIAVFGDPNQFSRAPGTHVGAAWRREAHAPFEIVHVGPGPIDAWFVPTRVSDRVLRVHLVRGLPPSDPTDAATQRAARELDDADREKRLSLGR